LTGGTTSTALELQSKSQVQLPVEHCFATTLCKLFTSICLCHHAI